jgi:hypothetical protein
MTNDELPEPELLELRERLLNVADIPVGMMSRLEVGVARAARARATAIGWESRVAIACLAFIVLGFGGTVSLRVPVAGVLGLVVLAYACFAVPDGDPTRVNE